MREAARRLARLEEAARGRITAHDADAAAAAYATLAEVLAAIAEKASGDVDGVAQRLLDGVLAAVERPA